MPGLEIAGVALAVLPILRSSLKGVSGATPKALGKYEHVIGSISRKLDLEHMQLHSTCTRLLTQSVSEEKMALLLSDSTGLAWNDVDVVEAVGSRLGTAKYELCVEALRGLAASIIALREDLGVGSIVSQFRIKMYHFESQLMRCKQTDIGSASPRVLEKAAKRLKASIKHKRHLELLSEIKDCNDILHRLVGDVLEMTPIRADRRSKLDAKKWESLRRLAANLYDTLEERLACNCGHCHVGHLRLESRGGREELEVRFGVLFTLDVQPQGWHETEIVINRAGESRPSTPPGSGDRPRHVSIRDPKGDQDTIASPTRQQSSSTRIDDLCKEFLQARTKQGCIGFVEDDNNREYYIHSVFPPTTDGHDLSLAQLLSRKEKSGIPALRGRDRYELAVILATSILQLHSTPWLDERNWREDVRFVSAKGKKAPFAYIRKRFNNEPNWVQHVSEGAHHFRDFRSSHSMVRRLPDADSANFSGRFGDSEPLRTNHTIFALGVILIELSLGRSLRSFLQPEDLGLNGQPNFLTDLSIAQRLVANEVQDKEGQRYANTVNRCINCLFDGIEASLEDEQFRQAFYQSAVVPLHAVRDDFIK